MDFEHLRLYKRTEIPKKSKGFLVYSKADRDPIKFYKTQSKKFDILRTSYIKDKKDYQKFFNPNLIFKIVLNKKVSDQSFRKELKRADIESISSAFNGKNYLVVFTNDDEFKKFREKIEKRTTKDTGTFIDAIESIDEIDPNEKLGMSLKEKPLYKNKLEFLDVEIWRMEDTKLDGFRSGFKKLIEEFNGEFVDHMTTSDFCLFKIKCDRKLFFKIIKMREVAFINRPPQVNITDQILESDIEKFEPKGSPDVNKPGILIVDSGINHPLVENAISDWIALPSPDGKIKNHIDDTGHGTQVAGIALYGDISKCIEVKEFIPQIQLYSAKVLFRANGFDDRAIFDENFLLERQLKDSIEHIINKYTNCRIINISFGVFRGNISNHQRQFRIASLIDELSKQYKEIIFVISTGNYDYHNYKNYPSYLINTNSDMGIFDPTTSAYGITVGSIYPITVKDNNADFPSPFTSVGPGLQSMIKPELVDYGGSNDPDLITINRYFNSQGRTFTKVKGTSYSAAKISHYLAKLQDKFPNESRNLLKALLLSSTTIPSIRPAPINEIDTKDKDFKKILNIYGFGKPNLNNALYSQPNRVLLTYTGEIGINCVDFFSVILPEEFKEKGKKQIEVTLVFDPPTSRNNSDYLGITMEYHLFKNSSIETLQNQYGETNIDDRDIDDIVPENIKIDEIKMFPGVRSRKKGVHQKSILEYKGLPHIDYNQPLVLAVICQKKWFDNKNYKQSYSVILTIKHEHEIDLYNKIKEKNIARARIR